MVMGIAALNAILRGARIGSGVVFDLGSLSPALSLKGEGACSCREGGLASVGNFRCCRLTPE
jgi:hypothetical protein